MLRTRKNILFILPSLGRGGAETQTIDLVNGIDSDCFNKYFLTFESNTDQINKVDRKNVTYVHCTRKNKLDFRVIRKIADIINNENIDLVHCSLQISLLMGWLGIRISKSTPKLILAVHTTINRTRQNENADYYLYQWLMRGCHKIIFVCKSQSTYWQSKYNFLKSCSMVIYNGVDANYFDPDNFASCRGTFREALGISSTSKVVCHIAGFRSEKGHLILLNAFNNLLAILPDTHLVFAGDGVLRSVVQDAAKSYGIQNNIHFIGCVSDVRPVLSACDVSVLASTAVETFSIAMLESMAMRVPLVATDIGGTSEAVLHNKTGLIVTPGSASELSSALHYMLVNNNIRDNMAFASRDLVTRMFLKIKMIRDVETLFHELLG
jgi:glycosyltransferase involved in cell wall biosynthesis